MRVQVPPSALERERGRENGSFPVPESRTKSAENRRVLRVLQDAKLFCPSLGT